MSDILTAEPQLFASDLDRARDFYVGKLGFEVAFSSGEPAFYMQVRRGGARLNLRRIEGPVYDAGLRAREGDVLAATLVLEDADALFREFEGRGVEFRQTLKDEPWGARTFIVSDPDGNLLCFAGDGG